MNVFFKNVYSSSSFIKYVGLKVITGLMFNCSQSFLVPLQNSWFQGFRRNYGKFRKISVEFRSVPVNNVSGNFVEFRRLQSKSRNIRQFRLESLFELVRLYFSLLILHFKVSCNGIIIERKPTKIMENICICTFIFIQEIFPIEWRFIAAQGLGIFASCHYEVNLLDYTSQFQILGIEIFCRTELSVILGVYE